MAPLAVFSAKFDIFTHFEAQFGWCSIVVMTDNETPTCSVQQVIWQVTEHVVVIVQYILLLWFRQRSGRSTTPVTGIMECCCINTNKIVGGIEVPASSDVPAPAWSQKPGQARPKKAGFWKSQSPWLGLGLCRFYINIFYCNFNLGFCEFSLNFRWCDK